ncbi:right-handed parallel beta-helix repeat-containing protein [Magnetospira sp. QH-2]|uniref:right-handed parallel beta-helix repeat-containing protein n=1 Tax=Magnetospira sp. (strain QH-2) TaxID=1288970 RepID=UPI0003E80B12|nr:right-handed parallel beta-helix repeat-containing protein [Magnetospira sp. QH-2]CCQ75417.1 conserved exported protein of unknown function with parallel beta-helix repeat [Magnetospira sp. QH-2]
MNMEQRFTGFRLLVVAALYLGGLIPANQALGDVLQVGPLRALKTPSAAAKVAKDGDIVQIDAGSYPGDVAVWKQNDLILRSNGGPVKLQANGQIADQKGIWVIKGDRVRVSGIEFSGAKANAKNGAGIRSEGKGLTVIGCVFRDNENGILTNPVAESDILVEHSEFDHNGAGDGYSHNMYITHVRSFTLRYSASHRSVVGHLVKSRAHKTVIAYNELVEGAEGQASYLIDVPNGGDVTIIGNVIEQSAKALNNAMIALGVEKKKQHPAHRFRVVNNTIVNRNATGRFIVNGTQTPVRLINNLAIGQGKFVIGPAEMGSNMHLRRHGWSEVASMVADDFGLLLQPFRLLALTDEPQPGFVDPLNLDMRLTAISPALDVGMDPGVDGTQPLWPEYEYVHPLNKVVRKRNGPLDLGAYER